MNKKLIVISLLILSLIPVIIFFIRPQIVFLEENYLGAEGAGWSFVERGDQNLYIFEELGVKNATFIIKGPISTGIRYVCGISESTIHDENWCRENINKYKNLAWHPIIPGDCYCKDIFALCKEMGYEDYAPTGTGHPCQGHCYRLETGFLPESASITIAGTEIWNLEKGLPYSADITRLIFDNCEDFFEACNKVRIGTATSDEKTLCDNGCILPVKFYVDPVYEDARIEGVSINFVGGITHCEPKVNSEKCADGYTATCETQIIDKFECILEECIPDCSEHQGYWKDMPQVCQDLNKPIDECKAYLVEEIKAMGLDVDELSKKLDELQLEKEEKLELIRQLDLTLEEQAKLISKLELKVEEQLEYIKELNLTLEEQAKYIKELEANLEYKAKLIDQLVVENEKQAELIKQMKLSFADQGKIIAELNKTIEDDAEIISKLTDKTEEQAEIIANMKLNLKDQEELIKDLKLSLEKEMELTENLKKKVFRRNIELFVLVCLLAISGIAIIYLALRKWK